MPTGTPRFVDDFPPVPVSAWRALVERDLAGAPFEKRLVTHTYEGIDIAPLYTAGDAEPGPRPVVAPEAGWDIRQERREPEAGLANARLLDDLRGGVSSVLLRLDLPGRRGRDADEPGSGGTVGEDGVSVSTMDELARVFDGVHLDMVGVALEAGEAFWPASAMLLALCRSRGVEPGEIRAAFNADPLAVLARDGRLGVPLDELYDRMGDLSAYAARELPRSRSVRVGSAPYHHAGATAVQDLAFSMATAVEYLRAMTARGLSVEDAAGQMVFSYAVGCRFFLASCKLRAARRLWARVIGVCGGDPASCVMMQHARTSKRVLTTRDPWVNILRNVAASYAAAVADADAVTTEPFDGAIGCPTELSARIARNTQIILFEESGIGRVTDPAGGAWFPEWLTNQLCEKAWAIFQEIERHGGMGEALRSGWVHEQIDSAFVTRAGAIARREDVITGVSEFPDVAERAVAGNDWDLAAIRAGVIERAGQYRSSRGAVGVRLEGRNGSRTASLIDAAAAGATLGELSRGVAREHAGERIRPIAPHPYAAPFERLREISDRHLAQCGERPRVFLVNLGAASKHGARAGFSANFFGAGGFAVSQSGPLTGADDASAAFGASGARVAVICSSDDVYESLVPEVAPALHRAGAATVVLAGRPGANEQAWRVAGVDRFIYIKCDAVRILSELLEEVCEGTGVGA